jgi:hypothetical protein
VRLANIGQGTAYDQKIDSAQPRIVENELGLLIDFRITGSSVDDAPVSPTLLLDFGDVAPGTARMGRWRMETTLSGEFVAFDAEFSHADELGGELTSLINDVRTHTLVREVQVDLLGRDRITDFLGEDAGQLTVYESNGLDTGVTDQSASAGLVQTGGSGDEIEYRLSAPATAGFFYVQLPDPHDGQRDITRAIRSDGKTIRPANVWLSRVRDGEGWRHFINLFDANTGGEYKLAMGPRQIGPQPPVLQFIPDRIVTPGTQVSFILEASDPNGTQPDITAWPMPLGAELSPDSLEIPGVTLMVFDWTPAGNQEGAYDIAYTASDGDLSTTRTARITVCGVTDTDCDGMNDAWELARFGTLARDGSGDFDGDGASDLDEYRNGTDPTEPDATFSLHLPAGLSFFAFPGPVADEHATCQTLLTTLGEVGAEASLMRIDAATQRIETCKVGDATDFPLETGIGYIAQLTSAHDMAVAAATGCAAQELAPGVNLRGHPAPAPGLGCFAWLDANGPEAVSAIGRFDPVTGRFAFCAWLDSGSGPEPAGTDFRIEQGTGYRIDAVRDGHPVLPGCP